MNPKIELTTVLQALKVAEHRSFRRAAEALGICQSSISKRVRTLEDVLGVDLFDRHHAGVKVTDAGRRFFEHIKMALHHLDSAVTSAGMAGRVENGSLKIGGLFCSLASGFLPELLRSYSAKHPAIEVSIIEGQPSENLARLRAGELDIVFVMGQPIERDCDVARLWSEHVFVVLPDTHALCGKDTIDWDDLKTEHFILTETETGVMVRDYVISHLAELHRRPDVRQSPVGRDTLVHLVGLGQGITLMNEAIVAMPFPHVAFRPMAGTSDMVPFSAVWLLRNSNQALRRFISLARTMSKTWEQTDRSPMVALPQHQCCRGTESYSPTDSSKAA
jgi:DNA-binding transcriptional LysR family regulator